ncbi:hypothetical protein SETIT_3G257900v2 [Setaria italica]|uniref:Uncharacterized protein n=1 Tax=Setaria italica TaxID=4555 RepID=A0A368QJK1_SETIT|nr:hypothetical protein SETIT_3G257900v2 [Setaria italica]
MFWRFVKTVCIATAGGIGGWKLRDRYEEMVGPVRPTSILARASKLWDSISLPSSSSGSGGEGGADGRRVRELEEKIARQEEKALRDMQKVLAAIEDLKGYASYQHEFPPPPPAAAAEAAAARRPLK